MSKIELPPLPPVVAHMHSNGEVCAERRPEASLWPVDLVDASELRARDRQIVELCASLAEALSDEVELIPPSNKFARGRMQGMWDCAAAIRSLLDPASPSSLPAEQQKGGA